jgi:serine/threonine protein kinase
MKKQALDFVHQNGFAQRDIKLENVVFDLFNRVKLIDFGFAKSLNNLKTNLGSKW